MSQSVASQPERTSLGLTIGILSGVLAVAFQAYAVATAMPAAAEQLHQLPLFAWAFSLFVIGMSVSTVLGGRACDARGPAVPAAIGLVGFSLGLVLAAIAPSMVVLVLGRFVQGLGGGLLNVALMVIVARAYPQHRRAVLMTAFSFCWVLPAFIGPPIAAWIVHVWSWRGVFWSLLPFMVLTVALCVAPMRRLRDQLGPQHEDGPRPAPIWSALVVAVGLAAVQAGGQRLDLLGALLGVGGVVALGVSLPLLMAPGFFRLAPGIAAVSWVRLLQAGSFFAIESFLPLSLRQIRGLSLLEAGLILTVGSVGWTTGSWLQSRRWLRLRLDQIIWLGVTCSAVGIIVATLSTWLNLWIGMLVLGWTIAGLGMGLATATGSLTVMQLSDPAALGRNTSSLQVSESLGNALFVGIAGTVFAALSGHHLPDIVFTTVFAVTCVVALLGVAAASRIGPVRNITSGVG